MMKHYIIKGIKMALLAILAVLVLGYVVMYLWNWLIPTLFTSVPAISFYQALGILALSKILFGGFKKGGCCGKHCGGHYKGNWRSRLEEKMANMSPEEKEKFKEKFGNKCKSWMDKGGEC